MSQPTAPAPELTRVVLGGTISVTHARPDGGRLELTLTRGAKRSSAVYALTDPTGRLAVLTARSWPNNAAEPALGHTVRDALGQADEALQEARA